MSDVEEPHDMYDPAIPLLSDVIVPGDPGRARTAPPMALAPEAPATTLAGASAVEAARGQEPDPYDADALAERLRGRCLTWLTGEGRTVVEERCRAALNEHADWLIGQVTREVGLALETELAGWVKEAVREAVRDAPASRQGGTRA